MYLDKFEAKYTHISLHFIHLFTYSPLYPFWPHTYIFPLYISAKQLIHPIWQLINTLIHLINPSPTSLYSFLHFHLIFHLLPFHFLSFLPTHPHKSKTLATFLHLPPSSRPNHLPPWISTQTFTFSSSPCVAKAPHLLLQRKCACRFNIWPHVLVLVLCRFQTIFIFCLVNSLIKTH